MGYTEWTYIIYLIVSVMLTVWVARTLFRNGRIFIIDACRQNETLADSINHLLVVGFYLINIGYVTLALQYGTKPVTMTDAFEFVSTKIGMVLVVLGFMHFFNLYVLTRVRRRGLRDSHELRHGNGENKAVQSWLRNAGLAKDQPESPAATNPGASR